MTKGVKKTQHLPENVTKLEGAERLLKTAITLFFEDGDMLAVHTLVAGTHEVLRTLLIKKGLKISIIRDHDFIRPEFAGEYHRLMNRTQNFLKHADTDSGEILDFRPAATPIWILDSIGMYTRLTGRMKHTEFFVFFVWFAQEHPKLLKEGPLRDHANTFKQTNPHSSKQDFLRFIRSPKLIPPIAFN